MPIGSLISSEEMSTTRRKIRARLRSPAGATSGGHFDSAVSHGAGGHLSGIGTNSHVVMPSAIRIPAKLLPPCIWVNVGTE